MTVSRRTFTRGLAGMVGIGAVAGLAACSESSEPTPSQDDVEPDVTVQVVDNAFEPPEVSISRGQAIRWEFAGTQQHDVVADDGSFVSELMREGSFTHVFEESGEFPYLCSVHPEMTGVVTVEA